MPCCQFLLCLFLNAGMSGTRLTIAWNAAPVVSIGCLQEADCCSAAHWHDFHYFHYPEQCTPCSLSPLPQVADPSLPIGMTEIGTMTSIFPIAYGFRCGWCCGVQFGSRLQWAMQFGS